MPDSEHEDDEEWDDEDWNAWIEAENDVADMPESPSVSASEEAPASTADEASEDEPSDADEEPVEEAAADEEQAPAPPPLTGPSYPEPPCTLVVAQGDCLLSIAHRYRMSERTIWNAGPNAALRAVRAHPNQLAPGDELHVPARAEALFTVETEQRHRFRVAARSDCEVVIRLLDGGEPRAGARYTLLVDGEERAGVAGGDGRIKERVARSVRTATLVLHLEEGDRRFPVRIGHLDPIEAITGVQARLNHLGFLAGKVDGWIGPRTRRALRIFQHTRELPTTGELDAATEAELRKVHGS